MSVRIYELSKKINLTNKETISLLQDRGFEVKSASSTIADIYAEDLIKEFGVKEAPKPKEKPAEPQEQKAVAKEAKPQAPKLPAGPIVKSAEDVAKAKAQAIAPEPKPVAAPVMPPKVPPAAAASAAPSISAAPKLPAMPSGSAPKLPGKPPVAAKAPKLPVALAPATSKESATAATAVEELEDLEKAQDALNGKGKTIQIKPPIVVRDFAADMDLKPFRLISELMEMGIFASMNQTIEEDVACKIAQKHGFVLEVRHRGEQPVVVETPKKKEEVKKPVQLEARPPVVCVLGHVDHGKTTLLDTIRKTRVVASEAGGITQHIGAYQITHNDHKITFIDTPGHAAFSKMRERGAEITDIAILVVAADDGFMPQTDEALKFAQKANVPVIVAINKMDAPGANIDKVKQQMQQRAIASEDWGGETLCAPISALNGTNIDELLELVLLQTEMLELKADKGCPAEGTIIESKVEVGYGPTATVIVEQGVLKVGDALVCGGCYCKVRALMDDTGSKIKSAPASSPVVVLGWSSAPESGAQFVAVKNDKVAKREAEENAHQTKQLSFQDKKKTINIDNLFEALESSGQKVLKVIIKGDVHGSVEALKACLENIPSEKVSIEVVNSSVGSITQNDVINASASEATIVGFNTKLDNGVQAILKHHNVRLIQHNIIYELIDQVKEAMAELLDPELIESKVGAAEIRQVFPVSKGTVAGCMVTEGKIVRDGFARLVRKGQTKHENKVSTLKRFKDDVNEVRSGYECGIQLVGFSDYQVGDVIQAFEIIKKRPTL